MIKSNQPESIKITASTLIRLFFLILIYEGLQKWKFKLKTFFRKKSKIEIKYYVYKYDNKHIL